MSYGEIANASVFDRVDGAASAASAVTQPYLSRIGDLAAEAEQSAEFLQHFIARCRGGGGDLAGRNQPTAPVPSGHFGQLDRLASAVLETAKLVRDLGTIG